MFVFNLQFGRAKADNSSTVDTIAQALPILGALAPAAAEWWKRRELRRQRGRAEPTPETPPPAQAEAHPSDIVMPDRLDEVANMFEILNASLMQAHHEITTELHVLQKRLDRLDAPDEPESTPEPR